MKEVNTMTYQKPEVLIIDQELVKSMLPIYDVACHCTGSGSKVCYSAGSVNILLE